MDFGLSERDGFILDQFALCTGPFGIHIAFINATQLSLDKYDIILGFSYVNKNRYSLSAYFGLTLYFLDFSYHCIGAGPRGTPQIGQSIRNALLGAPFPGTRSFFQGTQQERVLFSRDRNEAGTRS